MKTVLPSECVQVEQDAGIPDDLASAVELFKGDLPQLNIIHGYENGRDAQQQFLTLW